MDKNLADLRGMHVVTLAEGCMLGVVEEFYLDPYAKAICGMVLKPAGMFTKGLWLPINLVERVGEDVIFLGRGPGVEAQNPSGRSLRDLSGMLVTSKSGTNLGSMVDVAVDQDWLVTHVRLRDGGMVSIDPSQAVFGLDTVLLQADATQVVEGSQPADGSFFGRLFRGKSNRAEGQEADAEGQELDAEGQESDAVPPDDKSD